MQGPAGEKEGPRHAEVTEHREGVGGVVRIVVVEGDREPGPATAGGRIEQPGKVDDIPQFGERLQLGPQPGAALGTARPRRGRRRRRL